VDRGNGPKRAYAALIGRLILGQSVGEAEIERLPDPATFRDAVFLAGAGRWSPAELDDTDALLLALVMQLRHSKRG
jgi:hypothetical protein